MVDGDFFDKLEKVAQVVKKNSQPFGGIQLILSGDFFQLPPVSKAGEKKKFCFQVLQYIISLLLLILQNIGNYYQ